MSEEHSDESFLRTVAAVQAQMSLINSEADELTDLGDMQAQRKLKVELNEYVSAHSDSGIIPSNPLEVIGGRLKALSKFFSDTKSLELELLNIGENLLSVKNFTAHHGVPEGERREPIPEVVDCAECGQSLKLDATEQATGRYHCPLCDKDVAHKEQVKAPKISSDYLKSVLEELPAANESLPSKLELLKLRLDPLDWVDNYPGTKLHSELPLCASASQIDIPEDAEERANLHAFVHGAGPIHDKVKKHLEKTEKKTHELIETHESHRQTLGAVIECVDRGDHDTASKKLNTLGAWFSDLPYAKAREETGKLQKSCEDIISFCSNLPKARNHVIEDYRASEGWADGAYQKAKDRLANLNKKLEEHDAILKSFPNSELEKECKPLLKKAHTDLAKAEVELVDLMAKGSRYRRLTWAAISVVVLAIGLGIANQYNNQLIKEAKRARLAVDGHSSSIHVSARDGDLAGVQALLDIGVDVNAKNRLLPTSYAMTPLHYAAMNGHEKIAELLIDNGAEVNTKNENGWTTLHFAVNGHEEIVELLLAKGADMNAKDLSGKTPLDKAFRKEIADLLRKHGAKTSVELKASQN